ncbi:SGNH/GDSL hydrolase family protein [candidate division KSB1 bacterium]|nr:SGNH/GDSL hydrolase family protein [candidate division KSB1 bacterium]
MKASIFLLAKIKTLWNKTVNSLRATSLKRILFFCIAVLLPFLFLCIFEIILQGIQYGGDLSLFVPAPLPFENYLKVNPNVGKRFFGRQSTLPVPSNDVFLQQKPENGYRIFVMGGSTAVGFPYGNLLMFSRILHRRLQDTFPEKRIEVMNTALTAVNSWTLLDFLDEILNADPDLILIYAGHNEYYGALGVNSQESIGRSRLLIRMHLYANRFRIVRFVRDRLRWINGLFSTSPPLEGTLMQRIVREKVIPYQSPIYHAGIEQAGKNFNLILKRFHAARLPVMVGELVSNVRDNPPLDGVEVKDSTDAERMYHAARIHESEDQFHKARLFYTLAKDYDSIRFRAPTTVNDTIRNLAERYGAVLIPLQKLFMAHSPHGLIGDNLMCDHLHPNIDGYFLMADAFYESMKTHCLIKTNWDSCVMSAAWYRENWPISDLDHTIADLILKNLKSGWPFQSIQNQKFFFQQFVPRNPIESLAMCVLQDSISVGEAHFLLAKQFESKKDFLAAKKSMMC